jgi:methyl-accepting chemotaxis protein
MVWLFMYGLFALVILAGAFIMVLRGAVARPIAALNTRFEALASGDTSQPIDNPDAFYNEIGTLAGHYESLRSQAQNKAATDAASAS